MHRLIPDKKFGMSVGLGFMSIPDTLDGFKVQVDCRI